MNVPSLSSVANANNNLKEILDFLTMTDSPVIKYSPFSSVCLNFSRYSKMFSLPLGSLQKLLTPKRQLMSMKNFKLKSES